jgi:putative addiction module component (TIGR02574 family)
MTKAQERIIEQAMALPPEDRVEVAERILITVDPSQLPQIDPALAEEAERRIDALERGEDRTYPLEEVIQSFRARGKK